jgi:hypothetical protein
MRNHKPKIVINQITLVVLFLILVISGCQKSPISLSERLKTLPNAEVIPIKPDTLFETAYEIHITQPLDHRSPEGKSFKQRIYISHVDSTKPVIFVTEGYNANYNYVTELSRLLHCNQIIVEHRYFGESIPDSIDWQYLTIEQAANDHHRIIKLFTDVYKGKWISTGISKGGQTTMYHRYFFPKDVDVSIPYVAPLNFSAEDPRIYEFLQTVGTSECRDNIHDFQELILKRKDIFFPLFLERSKNMGYTYKIGEEQAFEYSVLEYSFAFWQYGRWDCSDIPDSTWVDEEIFKHFYRVSDFEYFSDLGIKKFEPFFYQAMTEIGFYGYDFSEFNGLLTAVKNPVFTFSAPNNVELVYNEQIMLDVNDYIQNKGNNFIFIYGETDTWSATAVELTGKTNSLKIVKKGGSHATRIRNLSNEKKEILLSTLEEMLGMKIDRSRI